MTAPSIRNRIVRHGEESPDQLLTPKQIRDRLYYQNHRAAIIERVTAYAQRNQEKTLEYHRQYRIDNGDKLRRDARAYRDERIDTVREKDRVRSRNPARRRHHYLTQQVPRRAGQKTHRIMPEQWTGFVAFCGGICLCCRLSKRLQIDHVVPISRGGKNLICNAQPLCGSCNKRKGVKSTDYRTEQQRDFATNR